MSEDTPKHGMGEPVEADDSEREALTKRIVHAKGGAFGTFTATNDEIPEGTR